ncbi:uncharacterized protein LOC135368098 [Ornithodoros turicata]|uniref:uncharacterized protein LOC135368098 n=1 Tax=Ornithodoros turicata TaxID=34597 RepID=UPI00313939A2
MRNLYPLSVVFIVFCSTQLGTGLRCYVCNSKYNTSCIADPPEKYLVDCETQTGRASLQHMNVTFKLCRAMYMNIDGQEKSVARSCGYREIDRPCYTTATMQVKSKVCQCNQDGCNASTTVSPSQLFFLITATAIMMILFSETL